MRRDVDRDDERDIFVIMLGKSDVYVRITGIADHLNRASIPDEDR